MSRTRAESSSSDLKVVSLFSGIGGIELGLATSGFEVDLLCEDWDPARAVLAERFEGVDVAGDIRLLKSLPNCGLLAAGFPCNDLSLAGRMAGIEGAKSGLISEVFRLLRGKRVPTVILENVRNMLSLHRGEAMKLITKEFEDLGYRWAYRVVDSRFTGVPHRRQRVILVASRNLDPRTVLHVDDAGEPDGDQFADDLYGFYWTEGLRGLAWVRDATPAIKNGSTLGIPSPPAIWNPEGPVGRRIVIPRIEDGERLQGFPRGWTRPADACSRRAGTRWRLVGNAVTVGVARWVGRRLRNPGLDPPDGRIPDKRQTWPLAGYGKDGRVYGVELSSWPKRYRYVHLATVVDTARADPLSRRATAGFRDRADRGNLKMDARFMSHVREHANLMASVAT